MKGKLRDLTKNTLIGYLPSVVNANNKTIKAEFDEIWNSDENYLTKSVYAPDGKVKAHWGDFVNLRAKKFIIDDPDFFDNLQLSIRHNDTKGRFSWEHKNSDKGFQHLRDAAHDIEMIYGLPEQLAWIKDSIRKLWIRTSVKLGLDEQETSNVPGGRTIYSPVTKEILDEYQKKIDEMIANGELEKPYQIGDLDQGVYPVGPKADEYDVEPSPTDVTHTDDPIDYDPTKPDDKGKTKGNKKKDTTNGSSVMGATPKETVYSTDGPVINKDYISTRTNEPKYYTYPDEYAHRPIKEIEGDVKIESDLNDLINGYVYNYYTLFKRYVKITNDKPCVLHAQQVGQQVDLLFEQTSKTNDFIVKLSGGSVKHHYRHLHIPAASVMGDKGLTRVTLICVTTDPTYGNLWEVLNYTGDIRIE